MSRVMQQPPLVNPENNSHVTIQMTANIVGKQFDVQSNEKLECKFFKEVAIIAAVAIAQVLVFIGRIFLLIPRQAATLHVMYVCLNIIYIIAERKMLQTNLKIMVNREEVTQKEAKQWYYATQLRTVFLSVPTIFSAYVCRQYYVKCMMF